MASNHISNTHLARTLRAVINDKGRLELVRMGLDVICRLRESRAEAALER